MFSVGEAIEGTVTQMIDESIDELKTLITVRGGLAEGLLGDHSDLSDPAKKTNSEQLESIGNSIDELNKKM